jgi:hypothetical protein
VTSTYIELPPETLPADVRRWILEAHCHLSTCAHQFEEMPDGKEIAALLRAFVGRCPMQRTDADFE